MPLPASKYRYTTKPLKLTIFRTFVFWTPRLSLVYVQNYIWHEEIKKRLCDPSLCQLSLSPVWTLIKLSMEHGRSLKSPVSSWLFAWRRDKLLYLCGYVYSQFKNGEEIKLLKCSVRYLPACWNARIISYSKILLMFWRTYVCGAWVFDSRGSPRRSVFVCIIAVTTVHWLFTRLVCSLNVLLVDCHTSETCPVG